MYRDPKFTHFQKLLLNNRLIEYGFIPTFQCIHQLCLFPGRKRKNIELAGARKFSFSIVISKVFHLGYRSIEYQQ